MSVKSSQILPASEFYHLGLMSMFMIFLACLCVLGFASVQDITRGWLVDIDNQLLVEIPVYDSISNNIYTTEKIDSEKQKIQTILSGDPIITDISIDEGTPLIIDKKMNSTIPAPLFISIQLRSDRADNAEDRIIKKIEKTLPSAILQTHKAWEKDIQKTSLTLKFLFSGMVLAILIVTSIVLSAIIRMQITSHRETLELIHLLGASSKHIGKIFIKAINAPLLWGGLFGFSAVILCLHPLSSILDISFDLKQIALYFVTIWIAFYFLGRLVTYWTVLSNLKKLP